MVLRARYANFLNLTIYVCSKDAGMKLSISSYQENLIEPFIKSKTVYKGFIFVNKSIWLH